MPIYAYACHACGHSFDRLQKLSEADPVICPQCGASALQRQVTAPAFRLAGSGWYETDFKKDGDKKRNLAGDGGAPVAAAAATPPAAAPVAATPAPAPSAPPASSRD